MSILNDPGCSLTYVNTGLPSCDFDPGNINWACLVPKAHEFTEANLASSATFIAAFQALTLNPPATRAYPIGQLDDPEDKSEETVFETTKYGSKIFVRDGRYVWQFRIMNCGVKLLGKLMNFNQTKNYKIIFGNSKNWIIGTQSTGVSGGLKGLGIDNIQFNKWKLADGSKGTLYTFEVTLSEPSELNENIAFCHLDSSPNENVKGILDVTLTQNALVSSASIDIELTTDIGSVNLFDDYAADLDAAGAWLVTKAGVEVTPASVAQVAATKSIRITLTAPAGDHVFSLVTPAALAVLGIGGGSDNGYESNTITATFAQP